MALLYMSMIVLISSTCGMQDGTEKNVGVERVIGDQGIDPDILKYGHSYKVPLTLSNEYGCSEQMPEVYRCSGCKAVAYQYGLVFSLAEKRLNKVSKLPNSEVLEVANEVCKSRMVGYGIKNVNGKNIFTGDGLKHGNEMGVTETGGRWQSRLKIMCREITDMFKAEEIYNQYVKRGSRRLSSGLCTKYCGQQKIKKLKKKKDEL